MPRSRNIAGDDIQQHVQHVFDERDLISRHVDLFGKGIQAMDVVVGFLKIETVFSLPIYGARDRMYPY